jgi:hypothetical protein
MSDDARPIDLEEVLRELQAAARGIDAASNELGQLLMKYEGVEKPDENGEMTFYPGTLLRWGDLVQSKSMAIVDRYENEGKRAPARETVLDRAQWLARKEDEELWAQYHAQRARINALQKWISAKRETISARQSLLKAHP